MNIDPVTAQVRKEIHCVLPAGDRSSLAILVLFILFVVS
ncbi:MAG: cobalt ABC transporter, partial [Chlorobium limicola]|nr:cobalt ABC transporter [Chlorobium limicola]